MHPHGRARDPTNERAVQQRLTQRELDAKLLSGRLLDDDILAASGAARAGSPTHAGPSPTTFEYGLRDAARAYVEDHGLRTTGDDDTADVLPEQKDFTTLCTELNRSLETSRDMFNDTPALIAKKQTQLREAVKKAQRKVPVPDVDNLATHFAFEDYQEYMRSVGVLHDEPNFLAVASEGNLQPIISILRDQTASASVGWRRVVRTINGYDVLDEIHESTIAQRRGTDDAEGMYLMAMRAKATQTDHNPNDKSLLGEIGRQAAEIAELREVVAAQQKRLTQWDIFQETVIKRMSNVLMQAKATQAAKEEQMGKLAELLAQAMQQNEALANKLSALTAYADEHEGAETGEDATTKLAKLMDEKKKIASTFTAALTRAKRQRYIMEQRCEALETSVQHLHEQAQRRLEKANRDLNTLHRGFLDGAIKDSMATLDTELGELSLTGPGGATLAKALDDTYDTVPVKLRKDMEEVFTGACARADEITTLAARSVSSIVQNGHKVLSVAEGIRAAAKPVELVRGVLCSVLRKVAALVRDEMARLEVQHQDASEAMSLSFTAQLREAHHEIDSEKKVAQLHRVLAAKATEKRDTLHRSTHVTESQIAAEMAQAALVAIESGTTSASATRKGGAKGKGAKGSGGKSEPAPSEVGPPRAAPKAKEMRDSRIPGSAPDLLLQWGKRFVSELQDESTKFAKHFSTEMPTRVSEVGYVQLLLEELHQQLGKKAQQADEVQAALSVAEAQHEETRLALAKWRTMEEETNAARAEGAALSDEADDANNADVDDGGSSPVSPSAPSEQRGRGGKGKKRGGATAAADPGVGGRASSPTAKKGDPAAGKRRGAASGAGSRKGKGKGQTDSPAAREDTQGDDASPREGTPSPFAAGDTGDAANGWPASTSPALGTTPEPRSPAVDPRRASVAFCEDPAIARKSSHASLGGGRRRSSAFNAATMAGHSEGHREALSEVARRLQQIAGPVGELAADVDADGTALSVEQVVQVVLGAIDRVAAQRQAGARRRSSVAPEVVVGMSARVESLESELYNLGEQLAAAEARARAAQEFAEQQEIDLVAARTAAAKSAKEDCAVCNARRDEDAAGFRRGEGHVEGLDPRDAVRLMARARGQKADQAHHLTLRSRGLTPATSTRQPDAKKKAQSSSGASGQQPSAQTPPPRVARDRLATPPPPDGRGDTSSASSDLFHVHRLKGKHQRAPLPHADLPKTPLHVMHDRRHGEVKLPLVRQLASAK